MFTFLDTMKCTTPKKNTVLVGFQTLNLNIVYWCGGCWPEYQSKRCWPSLVTMRPSPCLAGESRGHQVKGWTVSALTLCWSGGLLKDHTHTHTSQVPQIHSHYAYWVQIMKAELSCFLENTTLEPVVRNAALWCIPLIRYIVCCDLPSDS